MAKKLKIAHIAWEVEPFTKNGGLANVLRSLPSAHHDLGYEVVVITPYYKGVTQHAGELEVIAENVEIQIHEDTTHTATFLKGLNDGVPVYFISNNTFFGEHIGLYGAPNQNARFFFFDIAALTLLKHIGFKTDILHCHDWHSGLIPYFLKNRYKKDTFFEYTVTLFTISSGIIGGVFLKPLEMMVEAHCLISMTQKQLNELILQSEQLYMPMQSTPCLKHIEMKF